MVWLGHGTLDLRISPISLLITMAHWVRAVCANNVVPAEHLAFFLGLQDAGTCYGEEAYVTRLQ